MLRRISILLLGILFVLSISTCMSEKDEDLTIAAMHGNIDAVKSLIKEGADINACGWYHTPLIAASRYGHTEIVQLLLNKGADPNVACDDGNTALITACDEWRATRSRCEIVKLLIKAGANVNQATDNGIVPLMGAVRWNTEIVKLLIKAGADINASIDMDDKLTGGRTVLMEAAIIGYTDIIELLLEAGADIDAKDKEGDTVTRYTNRPSVIKLLKKYQKKCVLGEMLNLFISSFEQGET